MNTQTTSHPESPWTHPMCDSCWKRKNGDTNRDPARMVKEMREREKCCFCGGTTKSGIYVRQDPALLRCRQKGDGDGVRPRPGRGRK